jgi:hypothetical protein
MNSADTCLEALFQSVSMDITRWDDPLHSVDSERRHRNFRQAGPESAR